MHAIVPCSYAISYLNIGGADVIALLNESNRNADQPEFPDITAMWQNDWFAIWNNLTTDERVAISSQSSPDSGISTDPVAYAGSVNTDQAQAFSRMLQALTCKVVRESKID